MADLIRNKSGSFYYGQNQDPDPNTNPWQPGGRTDLDPTFASRIMKDPVTNWREARLATPATLTSEAPTTAPAPAPTVAAPVPTAPVTLTQAAPKTEPTAEVAEAPPKTPPKIEAVTYEPAPAPAPAPGVTTEITMTPAQQAAATKAAETDLFRRMGEGTATQGEIEGYEPNIKKRAELKQQYGIPLTEAEDAFFPKLGEEVPTEASLKATWGDVLYETWTKAGLINYNEQTGKYDYNIPAMAESVWESERGKELMTLASSWATGADDLMKVERLAGAEDLANAWRDNWRVLSENIAGMGIGGDGAAVLMMTQGNMQYMDAITEMNIGLLMKKKEFMKDGMDMMMDLLQYSDDAQEWRENMKHDYWSGITSALKHSLSVQEASMEFLGTLGYNYSELNWLQKKFGKEFGLRAFTTISDAVAAGTITADVFGNVFDAARAGDWDSVRTALEDSGVDLTTLDWYQNDEDYADLTTAWDLANYVYTIDEKLDQDGNTVYKPRLIKQVIDGKKTIARYEDNTQISALIRQADASGKMVTSTVEADGTVTHSISGNDLLKDAEGNPTQQAAIAADGTIFYEDIPPDETLPGELPPGDVPPEAPPSPTIDPYGPTTSRSDYDPWKTEIGVLGSEHMEDLKHWSTVLNSLEASNDYAALYVKYPGTREEYDEFPSTLKTSIQNAYSALSLEEQKLLFQQSPGVFADPTPPTDPEITVSKQTGTTVGVRGGPGKPIYETITIKESELEDYLKAGWSTGQ